MQNDPVYRKSNVVVSRLLQPEMLVLPVKAGSANLNEVYLLNETAGRIWQLLDGHQTSTQIIQTIAREYEVSEEEASADYFKLVGDLEQLALVDRVAP